MVHPRIPSLAYPFLAALLILVATGCRSQPSKYRKHKECECPKWNHRQLPREDGVHANLHGHSACHKSSLLPLRTA